ncbi:MAG TPA: hypothetical protein VGO18_23720 [Steroidobacteraceae bacterium]|nr:hypothetical protein [Steroidobacteraceae bacterium]
MPPTAHIVHALPGRMRLRIPSRRGDTPYFTSLVEQLSEHPSIHELRADPHSAGLVIHHGGLANAVLALAAEADLFITGESEIASIKHPPPVLLDATAAALSGLSVTQALRGEFLGSAAENFSNAYGSVRVLQRPGLAAIFGALGVLQLMRGEFLGSATSLLFYGYLARKIAEDMRQAERIAGEPAHDMPSA